MGEHQNGRRSGSRWLSAGLLSLGCIILGFGIGLVFGQPGYGLFIGLGAGLVAAGLSVR